MRKLTYEKFISLSNNEKVSLLKSALKDCKSMAVNENIKNDKAGIKSNNMELETKIQNLNSYLLLVEQGSPLYKEDIDFIVNTINELKRNELKTAVIWAFYVLAIVIGIIKLKGL